MRMTDTRAWLVGNPWTNWLLVRVDTDGGIHGRGERPAHRGPSRASLAGARRDRRVVQLDPEPQHWLPLFGEGWGRREPPSGHA